MRDTEKPSRGLAVRLSEICLLASPDAAGRVVARAIAAESGRTRADRGRSRRFRAL